MARSRGRVIVIDDDEGIREAIESLLDAAGYATAAFASAEALLAVELPSDTRCVVSDIRLPAMSGFELTDRLRLRDKGLPVILITAHDSPLMGDEATRHGAAAYLAKPFAGAALLSAIDRVSRRGGAGGRAH